MRRPNVFIIAALLALGLVAPADAADSNAPGAWDPAVSNTPEPERAPVKSPKATSEKPAPPKSANQGAASGSATPQAAPAQKQAGPVQPTNPKAVLETGAIASQGPPLKTEPTGRSVSGDWLLECATIDAKRACTLRQVVSDANKRRIIELRATSVGQTAFLEVTVPIGISIPYGVTVDVSTSKKLAARLVDCSQTGCRAVLALDAENLAALKVATSLAVTFQDSKSGKVISISGSAKGFEPAIANVFNPR
jgi:invasion protein IalB